MAQDFLPIVETVGKEKIAVDIIENAVIERR